MIREVPLGRLLSKAFLRPWEMPEAEAARMALAGNGNLRGTRFGRLRCGEATWESPDCGKLPIGLDSPLLYWVTPWLSKHRRPMGLKERLERRLSFPRLVSDFRKLVRMMDWKGWVGPPVPGVLLVDGSKEVFLFTDGNRRIGVASVVSILRVPIQVAPLMTFTWKATKAAGEGRFSEADTERIWDHVWERVDGKAERRDQPPPPPGGGRLHPGVRQQRRRP